MKKITLSLAALALSASVAQAGLFPTIDIDDPRERFRNLSYVVSLRQTCMLEISDAFATMLLVETATNRLSLNDEAAGAEFLKYSVEALTLVQKDWAKACVRAEMTVDAILAQ